MKPTNWQLIKFAVTNGSKYSGVYPERREITKKIRTWWRLEKPLAYWSLVGFGVSILAIPFLLTVYLSTAPNVSVDEFTMAVFVYALLVCVCTAWATLTYLGSYFEVFPHDFPGDLSGRTKRQSDL